MTYDLAITNSTREFIGHVDFNNVSSTYKLTENIDTDVALASYSVETALNDNDRLDFHYATFEEDYLDLDVGFYIPTLNEEAVHCPFTSNLVEPTGSIEISHDGADTCNGITIIFDEYGIMDSIDYAVAYQEDGEPATMMGTILREDIVNGRYYIDGTFTNSVGQVVLTLDNIVNTTAQNRLRIVEIDFGTSFSFGTGTLLSYKADNKVSITNEEMPINPFTMEIYDDSGVFEMIGTNTQLNEILSSGMALYPYIGIRTDTTPIFAQQGKYYLKSIDKSDVNKYTFNAEDGMTILNSTLSNYRKGSPLGALMTSKVYVDNMFEYSNRPESTIINPDAWTADGDNYYIYGLSTLSGTPSPDAPATITSNYPAGRYMTTLAGKTYVFYLDSPLRSADDGITVVADQLWIDTSTDAVTVDTYVYYMQLNGDQTWTLSTTYSDATYLCAYSPLADIKSDSYIISEYFPYGLYTDKDPSEMLGIIGMSFNIKILKTRAATVGALKTWLGSNPFYVQFEANTPTIGTKVDSFIYTQDFEFDFDINNSLPNSTYVADGFSKKWNFVTPLQEIGLITGCNTFFGKDGDLYIKPEDTTTTRTITSSDLVGSPVITKGNELKKIQFNLLTSNVDLAAGTTEIYSETGTTSAGYRQIEFQEAHDGYTITVDIGANTIVDVISVSDWYLYLYVNTNGDALWSYHIDGYPGSEKSVITDISGSNNGDELNLTTRMWTLYNSQITGQTPTDIANRIFAKTDKFKIEFDYRGDFYIEPLDLLVVETTDGYKLVTVYEADINYDGSFSGHIVGGFSEEYGGSI